MEKSSFIPRSYSKSELAILYSPSITPGLLEQLAATGMLPNAKCYTPIQVHVIVEALGEP